MPLTVRELVKMPLFDTLVTVSNPRYRDIVRDYIGTCYV